LGDVLPPQHPLSLVLRAMSRIGHYICLAGVIIPVAVSLCLAGQATPGVRLRVHSMLFLGNGVFSQDELRAQMKAIAPSGLISSILRTDVYTREKAEADVARIRVFLADHGYIRAYVGEPQVEYINPVDAARTSGDVPIRLIIPISEGALHRLRTLVLTGATVISNIEARNRFHVREGDSTCEGHELASL
jgi:outer membrane protein assembly factor BamA